MNESAASVAVSCAYRAPPLPVEEQFVKERERRDNEDAELVRNDAIAPPF